jgi:hypothetical protein
MSETKCLKKSELLRTYINKPADQFLRDFSDKQVRILFPGQNYRQDSNPKRYNLVVDKGIIIKIWKG